MALLRNLNTGESVNLMPQHLFGRHPVASNTLLESPSVSRMHASIFYDGEHWLLQDTSTNGTFVNGQRVQKETRNRLYPEDKIQFAQTDGQVWQLLDDTPPKSMLIPESEGVEPIVLDDLVVLPNEEAPEVSLFLSPAGQWICESEAGVSILSNGDLVGTHDCVWRFVEARSVEQTIQIEAPLNSVGNDLKMCFEVSRNEEHVTMTIELGGETYDLGERNHHYLLLLLARKRLEDGAEDVEPGERGWIDKERLGKMLGQSETHINIQVYRFRKQLIKALPSTLILPQVIERRSGQIRFVYDNISIEGGVADAANG